MDEEQLHSAQPATGGAIAALALAVVSLIGMNPAQLFGQSLLYHQQDFRTLAVAPGIGVLVAGIALWLSRRYRVGEQGGWVHGVATGAGVVAPISVVINLAAFLSLVTLSHAGPGVISG